MKEKHHCERCGYDWRGGYAVETPKRCARCRSRYWQTPRRLQTGYASKSLYVVNPSVLRRQAIEADKAARAAAWEAQRKAEKLQEQRRRRKTRLQRLRRHRARARARA